MKSPGLSLIVVNRDHRNGLPRSVRSVIMTGKVLKKAGIAHEILFIDGGSRDGSQKYLLGARNFYPASEVQLDFSEEVRTMGALRNSALKKARFRHTCFLDGAHELLPENIGHFLRAARETEAAIVYGNLVRKEYGVANGMLSNEVLQAKIYSHHYIEPFSIVDNEQALLAGGYQEDLDLLEGWEFLQRLVADDRKIIFVPMLMGYAHKTDGDARKSVIFKTAIKIRQIYNQTGSQDSVPRLLGRIYHPEIGYLG